MLTDADYSKLWENYFKITKIKMPDYDNYVIRENMLQDYLDIFRSKNTRYDREIRIEVPPKWDYNHPYFDVDGNPIYKTNPTIKYILIAEAPPTGKSYFYNCNHLDKTPYFNAVCKAFDIIVSNPLTYNAKLEALIKLAKKGVLLLDLFPFSIPFTTPLRKRIIKNGIVKHFWDEDDYSIKTQILALCPYLDTEWDLCLIAPPTLSCHIVGAYEAIDITPCNNGIHINITFKSVLAHPKRGCDYKKVASDTSGNPNAELIKVAFNLI